jgi:hypothetical protein
LFHSLAYLGLDNCGTPETKERKASEMKKKGNREDEDIGKRLFLSRFFNGK